MVWFVRVFGFLTKATNNHGGKYIHVRIYHFTMRVTFWWKILLIPITVVRNFNASIRILSKNSTISHFSVIGLQLLIWFVPFHLASSHKKYHRLVTWLIVCVRKEMLFYVIEKHKSKTQMCGYKETTGINNRDKQNRDKQHG